MAAAAGTDCRTIATLADPHADWSILAAGYRKDGLIDLGVAGKSDRLTGFTACDLDGGRLAEVDCSWKDLPQAEALSRFEQTRAALATCIKADFILAENTSAIDGLTVRRDYSATVEAGETDSAAKIDISLKLLEFGTGDYWVDLDFQR